ncbi:MAG: VTT domain-containing protein [Rhodobacteraceae bacterium]|nr:VTT domain-containing protein [Paracoccaceae bacterium]
MIRQLYDWTMRLAGHRHALAALAVISFLESSVFPVPPDALLIPIALAQPGRAFLAAGICLAASVLGGLFGYLLGAVAFDQLGGPILQFLGKTDSVESFFAAYNEYGAWAVLFAGLTPFPYKVITILSGATGLSLPVFVAASILSRGIRFFLVAALLWKFGEPIRALIERYLSVALALLLAAAAAIYFSFRLL